MSTRSIAAATLAFALCAHAELPSPKVLERYRQMILANPVEGTALDRLWKAYSDEGRTGELVEQFQNDPTFAGKMVLGHLLRRSGDWAAAAAAYKGASEADPKNPMPKLALGRVLKDQRSSEEAIHALEEALTLLPNNSSRRAEILLEVGTIWAAAGQHEKATEAWERTVALSPSDLSLRRKLADTYLRNGLGEQALRHLEYIVENASPTERAAGHRELSAVHQGLGDIDAAIGALESGIALTRPGNWLRDELLGQLIRLHQREQRVAELEKRWVRHVDQHPRDLGGYLQLLALYERIGDLENQRATLEKLTSVAPQTAEYRARLAMLLVRLDDFPAATKLIDELLVEQPGSIDLIFERARLDVLQGAAEAAQGRITGLLQRSGADETVRSRAMAFYQKHRLWNAVEAQLSEDASRGNADAIVAFAEFLFSQGRVRPAEEQLQRLVNSAADPNQKAAVWERVARVRKAQGRIDSAADAAMESLSLMPRDALERRALLLFHGELRSTLNQPELAQAAYEEAFQLSRTASERMESDQRLFDVVRQQAIPEPDGTNGTGLLPSPVAKLGSGEKPNAVDEYLKKLTQEAEATRSADAWLRVAQWHSWRRDMRSALDAANKAAAAEPGATAPHEFIIQLTASDPNSPTPGWHLAKLIEIDPAGASRYRRRAAQLELQAGRPEQAIGTLHKLLEQKPGDIDTLIELATAQQQAGQLKEALVTWQRVHAANPSGRKSEVLNALVQLHHKLNDPESAADLLLKEIEIRKDPREKEERFTELLTLCKEANLLPWLRERWEQRRRASVEDYFIDQSMGKIMKAQGERNAAFELLSRASFSAPDSATALPELVREAEDLYRLDDAIALQTRVLRVLPADQADQWIRLAELQERNCDFAAAAGTWTRIVARHPRDSSTLMGAAEFFLHDGNLEKAREALRRVRAIEPTNTAAASRLAELEIQLGNVAKAREPLETILVLTTSEQAGEPIQFPALRNEDGNRLQSEYLAAVRNRGGQPKAEAMRDLREFWTESAAIPKHDRPLRLKAIQHLAEITVQHGNQADRKAWMERWQRLAESTPGEGIWALYYAGFHEEVLELVRSLMRRDPANVQYKQAFIWLALRTRQVEQLATWSDSPERTTSDRDFVIIALGQYLEGGGIVDQPMLDRLFPVSSPTRLWQVAALLAARSKFDLAAALGSKAFEQPSVHRQAMGFELAHWYLCLGQPERARTIFKQTSELGGDSFEAYSYSALRALYLLSSELERTELAVTRSRLQPGAPPVPREISGAILQGLAGNLDDARLHLNRLVQMGVLAGKSTEDQAPVTSRPWTFLLSAGLHLQAWKMPELAEHLWEQALADQTLVRLQGDHAQEVAGEMRLKLIALKLAQTPAHEVGAKSTELLRDVPEDYWMNVGESLEMLGALSHAVQFYRLLWDRDRSNPQAVRNLLNACQRSMDEDTSEWVLRECLAGRFFPNESVQRDFAMQLVDLLVRRSDHAEAMRLLEAEILRAPNDIRFHLRLATLQETLGLYLPAEESWKRILSIDPSHSTARKGLATLQRSFGRYADALATLRAAPGAETSPLLPGLLFRIGHPEEALDALKQVSKQDLSPAFEELWAECLRVGNRRFARLAAQVAQQRTSDPALDFHFHTKVIESFDSASEQLKIRRELRNLERRIDDAPLVVAQYHRWLTEKAESLRAGDYARQTLTREWDEGRGRLSAGAALLKLQFNGWDSGGPRTLSQILRRDDAGTQLLEDVLSVVNSSFPRLSPAVHERLAQLNPLQDQSIVDWAKSLQRLGDQPAALRVLERWGARAWLNEEFAAKVAVSKGELHARGDAERLFHFARAQDIPHANHPALLAYAEFRRQQSDFPGVRTLLSEAYANPGCTDFKPLVHWLENSGELSNFDRECASFRLSPRQRVLAREALFAHYVNTGKDHEAFGLLESRPRVITGSILAGVEQLAARTGDYSRAAAVLERHLQESAPPFPQVLEATARMKLAQAKALREGGNEREAVQHLKNANELAPAFFAAAKELALHFQSAKQPQEAAKVWDRLIAQSRNREEREEATRLRGEVR